MDTHNSDGQAGRAPAQVYLLQVDSNFSTESPAIPLQLLNNAAEYEQVGHDQYLLPILTPKQNNRHDLQVHDQLQILIGPNDKNSKLVSLLVDNSHRDLQKQHIHISSVQAEPSTTSEHLNGPNKSRSLLLKQPLNITDKHVNIGLKIEQDNTIANYVHISDRNIPPRAVAVLPPVLQMRARDVIYPRRMLPAKARFGPVEGIRRTVSYNDASVMILNASSNKTPLFLIRDESYNIVNIDVTDKDKSNWIGLLPLGDQNTANVWLYEENHQLYAITTESIPSRKTLKLGYSEKYAADYGLVGQPTKDILTAMIPLWSNIWLGINVTLLKDYHLPNGEGKYREDGMSELSKDSQAWWCYECQRAMPSASMLQRHLDIYHRDFKPSKRRYQCRNCTRTFARLFTLRRHRIRHCTMKPSNSDTLASMEVLPEIGLTTEPNTDDNRLPSDESFQNYSNGLDFSTTLFDTDRIGGLDISGNSRSEGEFNPYSIGYKDDNALVNDLEFANPCSGGTEIPQTCVIENKTIQDKNVEPILCTCPYCNQVVVKEKKRKHIRECSARRFECECGKLFTNKRQLAIHIRNHPPSDFTSGTDQTTTTVKNTTQYKCEKCEHHFKRRGMLVNHLWRIHKTVSATVPLEKRIRHYPCVVCPKIYRSAAKRDRHVTRHHPGADKNKAQSIEGGVRACQPAHCSECPRQYSTRAKLLQHQRHHHPHLATPLNKKPLKPKSNNANNQFAAAEELIKFRTSYYQML